MIQTSIVNVGAFKELAGKVLTAGQAESLVREIAVSMYTETFRRIHNDGKKADGSPIGTYSNSYLEWRRNNGYPSSPAVKLFLTGQMQQDYKVVPLSKTEYGLGYDNKFNADKADWAENGTTSASVKAHKRRTKSGETVDVSAHTRRGREGYGKIFALTPDEMDDVRAIVTAYIQRIFK